jgi:hypothetical protein
MSSSHLKSSQIAPKKTIKKVRLERTKLLTQQNLIKHVSKPHQIDFFLVRFILDIL